MVDRKFPLVLLAVDRFSAVFQKAISSVLALNKPITETQKNLREIDKDRKIRTVTDDVKLMNGAFSDAMGVVTSFVPVLAGIGTAVGIARTASEWASWSQGALNAQRATGVMVERMQGLEAATLKVGIANGVATQSIESLAAAAHEARWGRNADLFNFAQVWGIDIGTREKPRDPLDVFKQFVAVFDRMRAEGKDLPALGRAAGIMQVGGLRDLLTLPTAERARILAEGERDAALTSRQAKVGDRMSRMAAEAESRATQVGGKIAEGASGGIDSFFDNLFNFSGQKHRGIPLFDSLGKSFRRKINADKLFGAPETAAPTTAAPSGAAPFSEMQPRPGESIEAFQARQAAAKRRESDDELKRLFPQIFSPTTYQPVRPQKVIIDLNVNGAAPGSSAAASVEGDVEVTTRFGHSMKGPP